MWDTNSPLSSWSASFVSDDKRMWLLENIKGRLTPQISDSDFLFVSVIIFLSHFLLSESE